MSNLSITKRPSSDRQHYFEFVDGLRCIAVLFVFFFHFGIKTFSGGFIGVDIFFVISGFLMTRILTAKEPTFANFGTFLIARVRRIFPAYIVMLVIVAAAACIILFPDDLLRLAPGLFAAVFFLSNFVFRAQANYFDQTQSWNPILHTWSLGVEWQFYLLFPLVLMLARRAAISLWLLLGTISVASFGWSIVGAYAWHASPTAAFFLLPARVWEFMAGTCVALAPALSAKRRALSEAACLLGLIALFWCAFSYNTKTVFPGPGAVLPCLGTALIMYYGTNQTLVAQLLSLPPLRLIGQASYSIYLWHWPLIVLYKYRFVADDKDQGIGVTLVIIVMAILIGIASWRFIELPFRKSRARSSALERTAPPNKGREKNFAYLAFVTGALPLLIAGLIYATQGLPMRFSHNVLETLAAKKDSGTFRECASHGELCQMGQQGIKPSFILFGDSHAAALADGFDEKAKSLDKAGYLVAVHACAPLFNVQGTWADTRDICAAMQKRIPQLLTDLKPDQVFLHGNWQDYRGPGLETAIDNTFRFFHDRKFNVTVIGDTPVARANVPFAIARREAFGLPTQPALNFDEYSSWRSVIELLHHYADKYGFRFVDLGLSMCETGTCLAAVGDKPLYFDTQHLSGFGSRYIVETKGSDWLR